jgi:hypothetical protein
MITKGVVLLGEQGEHRNSHITSHKIENPPSRLHVLRCNLHMTIQR